MTSKRAKILSPHPFKPTKQQLVEAAGKTVFIGAPGQDGVVAWGNAANAGGATISV